MNTITHGGHEYAATAAGTFWYGTRSAAVLVCRALRKEGRDGYPVQVSAGLFHVRTADNRQQARYGESKAAAEYAARKAASSAMIQQRVKDGTAGLGRITSSEGQ